MNPTQVDLVQSSFSKVVPIADVAAELFYNRLFELDPSLRALFRSDMKEQGKKLMAALQAVVGNLKNLDRVVPGVQAMAMRHVSYGVKNSDYAVVGQALIDTLEKGLGADFTPEVREAWLAAYTILANTMKAAASAPQQAA
jgi:hemoglobin-like flavoprotein